MGLIVQVEMVAVYSRLKEVYYKPIVYFLSLCKNKVRTF